MMAGWWVSELIVIVLGLRLQIVLESNEVVGTGCSDISSQQGEFSARNHSTNRARPVAMWVAGL